MLRPVELKDVDVLFHWENDPKNWLVSNTLTPFSKFFLEQYVMGAQNNIYADHQLRLIVEDKEGKACGALDLFDFEPHHRRAAIGILIEENSRGKGFAGEALELVCNYARNILNLHQLYCTIDEDNEKSMKLFGKLGFQVTGKREHWTWREGKWIDEYFLQLILKAD